MKSGIHIIHIIENSELPCRKCVKKTNHFRVMGNDKTKTWLCSEILGVAMRGEKEHPVMCETIVVTGWETLRKVNK